MVGRGLAAISGSPWGVRVSGDTPCVVRGVIGHPLVAGLPLWSSATKNTPKPLSLGACKQAHREAACLDQVIGVYMRLRRLPSEALGLGAQPCSAKRARPGLPLHAAIRAALAKLQIRDRQSERGL